MADLKISALNALAGADLVAADVVAVVDNSAGETKKLTVSDLVANGVTLISDATIPSAKVLFSAGSVNAAALASSAVETAKINNSAVTAAKLADNSSVTLVSTLPGSGDFVGQVALDTDDSKIYVWSGSAWTNVKGAGSINVVNGSTSGLVNITATTSGDTVTISTTLDDTSAARQFLAGPTGSGGTVGYRAIIGTDLPTASNSAKGGVIVNGNGLAMSGDTLTVNNSVTAETTENHLVKYDANGLVTSGRVIASGDVPVATSSATGAVLPGTGLGVTGSGVLNHTNSLTAATGPKITFDAQGHVTGSTALAATDIPDLDAAKLTTGNLPSARIADDAITADKLADRSTATIAEVTPAGGAYIGQLHLNSISSDIFLWDGNVWQPIGISVGEIVLAGTYNATTNLVATVTSEGTAVGYTVGSALPAASSSNKGHYVIVSTAGTGTSPAPTVALAPPDFLLSTGTLYTEIDVSQTVTAQQASNVQFTPTGSIASNNVQTALAEVDTEKAPKASPTFSGTVSLDTAATIQFEGSSANDFETTLTVTNPTADRTLALPNVSGDLVSTGDTGSVTSAMITDGTIVNADINASAEIAVSKLANGTARQLLQTDAGGSGVEFTSNVDVPGTLDVTSAATFDSTVAVTGLLSANGKLAYPAGSAAAVSLYSGSDTDTGIYSPGSNQFGISTAGTPRIVVDSLGKVGIGETSPAAGLDIKVNTNPVLSIDRGTANTANFKLKYNGTDTAALSAGNADFQISAIGALTPISFYANGSERMQINSSGNVGIGRSTTDLSTPDQGVVLQPSGCINVFRQPSSPDPIFVGGRETGGATPEGNTVLIYPNGAATFASTVSVKPDPTQGAQIELTYSPSGGVIYARDNNTNINITLNGADGSATFVDEVVAKKFTADGDEVTSFTAFTKNASTDFKRFTVYNTDTQSNVASIKGDGSASFTDIVDSNKFFRSTRTASNSGELFFQGKVGSTTNCSLAANGSASFAGQVLAGNSPSTTARDAGSLLHEAGILRMARTGSGSNPAIEIYKAGTNTKNVSITGGGAATFAGNITAGNVSDIKFKENITDAHPQLDDVVALGSSLKNWDWNDDAPLNEELRARRFLGLVAQEAEKVCPGLTYTVPRTKQGAELTPEVVVPAVYETRTVPAVLDEEGKVVEAETTEQVLVTEEQVTPATYEELDDSYKAINHDILVMKLLGAVAELSAKVEALEAG